jgi:hypothetical protein
MSYTQIYDSENDYRVYYDIFKHYSIPELLSMCEQNRLSIYGEKTILADRLALHFSEKNKPSKITVCMNSIKQIIFKI